MLGTLSTVNLLKRKFGNIEEAFEVPSRVKKTINVQFIKDYYMNSQPAEYLFCPLGRCVSQKTFYYDP